MYLIHQSAYGLHEYMKDIEKAVNRRVAGMIMMPIKVYFYDMANS